MSAVKSFFFGSLLLVSLGSFVRPADAQTGNLSIVAGKIDFHNAVHTATVIVVANVGALPATGCTVGELAIVTAATLGQQIYENSGSGGCVWTQQLDTGSSSGGGITVYSAASLSLTGTQYIPIGGGGLPSATETDVDTAAPTAATVTNFDVQMSAAPGMGNSIVFTWRKNTSSQSLTCTISGAVATSCSDNTHSFSVSQGDLLTIQLVTTGVIAGTPNLIVSAQFGTVGSNGTVNTGVAGQVAYFAANGTAVSGENLFAANAQSGTYQVLASDFVGCKTIPVGSGTFTITLVASGSQPPTGQCIDIINYGSGVVTIARSGQNINGGTASITLPAASAGAPASAHIVSDGANYFAETSVGASGGSVTNIKCNHCTLNGTSLTNTYTNDTGTGTTLHKLAKLTGAPSTVVISGAGDTGGSIGIVDSGAGNSGSAEVTIQGIEACVFDGATTAGHYVTISASVAGDCTDGGATYPLNTQVIGRVLSTNGGAGTYNVALFGAEFQEGAIANGTVTSAKQSVEPTRRTQCLIFGANNGSALVDADLGPQSRQYFLPYAATLVEMEVAGDAGTPNIILGRSRAGSIVNVVSAALATASAGGIACSNTGGTTGIDGATTCSATLQNTGWNAGDWIVAVSGTAGGTAKEMTACLTFVTVN